MNKLNREFSITLKIFLAFAFICRAQTTLSAGDIAIVGFNSDNPDEFAFVVLTNIEANTQIKFTDAGWTSSGTFRNGEGAIQFTANSDYIVGDVIIYSGIGGEWSTYSVAPLNGTFSLGTTGDQIIAFQGTATSPAPLLYATDFQGSSGNWQSNATNSMTSALPTGLSNGTSAVAIVECDNAYYNAGANPDLNALRTAIGNNSNWTRSNSTRYILSTIFASPLPVELVAFSAVIQDKEVTLKWKTETEVNNYGFEIQRSLEKQVWKAIGFVEGNGNSNFPIDYTFTDAEINSYGVYYYRLKQLDNDGTFEFSKTIDVTILLPGSFNLSQNYPNPFNPCTKIKCQIPEISFVTLKVYNVLGSEVATLINEEQLAGEYEVNFDGSKLTSGIYFYQLKAGSYSEIKKMTLMK